MNAAEHLLRPCSAGTTRARRTQNVFHIARSRFVTRYKVAVGGIFLSDDMRTFHCDTILIFGLLYRLGTRPRPRNRDLTVSGG